MMETNNFLAATKTCFGRHEDCDNSWHCKGCPVSSECERKTEENKNE